MANILFVDDSQERYYRISLALAPTGATLDHARTMDEALGFLLEGEYDIIFLDHDLGENAGSGRGVAEYIARDICPAGNCRTKFLGCTIVIHSSNTAGSNNMMLTLQEAIRHLEEHLLDKDIVETKKITLIYAPLKHADPNFLRSIGLL